MTNVIEDFNSLSDEERLKFATDFLANLNAQHIVCKDTLNCKIDDAIAELDGSLTIWTVVDEFVVDFPDCSAYDEDPYLYDLDMDDCPANCEQKALEQMFTTTNTTFEGYNINITAEDFESNKLIKFYVTDSERGDDGIGHYEYWGEVGYDSRPYTQYWGTATISGSIALGINIVAADSAL